MAAELAEAGSESPRKSAYGLVSALIVGVSVAASSFATNYLLSSGGAHEAIDEAAEHKGGSDQPLADPDHVYTELDEIIITIGGEPADRYLKLRLAVITAEGDERDVKDAEPLLMDAFTSYLRAIEPERFEDHAFFPQMREQLAQRAELVLGGSVAEGVLITEFLLR